MGESRTFLIITYTLLCLKTETVSRVSSSKSKWKQMQRPTAKHQVKVWESCGSLGVRTNQAEGLKDITRHATESINLGPWGLSEIESPIKEHAGAGPRLSTHL